MEVDNFVISVSKLVKEGHTLFSNMGTAAATNAVNALKYFMIAASTVVTERGAYDFIALHPLKSFVEYLDPPKVAGSCLSKTKHVGFPNYTVVAVAYFG
jgi:hypothetical protein